MHAWLVWFCVRPFPKIDPYHPSQPPPTRHTTHTQIFDKCLASANSAYPAVRLGLQQYLALGADPQKLVLGTSDKQKQMVST